MAGYQQRWSRPLPGAILIPPALLVVADFDLIRTVEFSRRCKTSVEYQRYSPLRNYMRLKYKILLTIDCIVNILLGTLLLLFPIGVIDLLGLPKTNTNFYPSILGAVILGIGLALFLELAGYAKHFRGLGLGGAILINLVGSLVLVFWLLFGSLSIPIKGQIILWAVALIVFLIGIAELFTKSWIYENNEA